VNGSLETTHASRAPSDSVASPVTIPAFTVGDRVRVDDEPTAEGPYEALVVPDGGETITASQANARYSIASVHLVARALYLDADSARIAAKAAADHVGHRQGEKYEDLFRVGLAALIAHAGQTRSADDGAAVVSNSDELRDGGCAG
jgi:hypothetical protein